MPDWMIQINHNASGTPRVRFAPNPREVLAGDIINWRNNDTRPHWPAPLKDGKIDQTGYMPNQIPPGATSNRAFSPGAVQQNTDFEYCCALHPDEKGVIRVLVSPPSPSVV